MLVNLIHFFQKFGFRIAQRLGERLGIRTRLMRVMFIYFSFMTLGAGFALYLFIGVVMKIKDLFHTKRTSVFDL